MSARGRRLAATLVVLLAAPPAAFAEPAGGEAPRATGHGEAAGRSNGPPKDGAPANETPREHGSHAATRARTGLPADAGESAPRAGGRHAGPHPGEGTGGANAPTIDARPFPAPRVTPRPINAPLPKPFGAAKPHVRHPPAFAVAVPARNAIGMPLDHPPIAKPLAVMPPGAGPAAKSASGGPMGGTAPLHPTLAPPIPPVPRNAGLNGTTIRRVGTGPATVGGAARFTTGIDGTSFRPKHGN